jgi:glycosyltransferase involved in cell wall biosynthesis
MGEPRVAVIMRYGLNREAWRRRFEAGEVVDAAPYGYQLADERFALDWSVDHRENVVAGWWRGAVRHALGFDLVHVWRNRRLLQDADAVWTHTEREHLAVAAIKALRPRRYRFRSIAQSVWLWDLWPTLSRPRKALFRRLLRRHDIELVLSRVNRDDSRAAVPGRTVVRVPFGTHLATPRTAGARAVTPRVLVVGNDRHRDWNLMAQVATLLPDVDFDVITRADAVRALPWPANTEVRGVTQTEILTNAYSEASLVAVPLLPNRHASGCTVAIEGISAGLPVVASDTGGIDEYVTGSTSTLVAVGDAEAFAAAIRGHLAADEEPDATVAARRGLSEHDYIDRLVSVTRSLLAGDPLDPAVEQFAPVPQAGTGRGQGA